MRILVFSPMVRFAMQDYLQCIANEQDRLGHEPIYILPSHHKLKTRHKIFTISGGGGLRTLWTNVNPLTFLRLAWIFHRTKPDVVHFLNGETRLTVLWLLILCRLSGTRAIMTVHDPEPHPCAKIDVLAYNLVGRRSISIAKEINIHDKAHVEFASTWQKDRLHVFPLPDTASLFPKDVLSARENVVLFFGRIEPYKGIPNFVRLGLRFKGRARFVIAGSGTIDADSQRLINENPDIFEVHNRFIEDTEMLSLYDRAKVVVLPYDSATQSGIPASAASRGAVPVGFAVGGLVNQIPEVGGHVVAPGDIDAMEQVVTQILQFHVEPDGKALAAAAKRFATGLENMYRPPVAAT